MALRNFGLSREVLAGVSLDADTTSCIIFSVQNPPTSLGNSATGFFCTGSVSLLSPVHCSESRNWSPSNGLLVLRRRVVAGLDVESSVESCGNDVGDVFAVELEDLMDNPGTSIGT